MQSLEVQLKVPDYWQQEAIRHLQEGRDVVVAAPTGAGKTYIFELLVANGYSGQAVYTVPTRALANDKRLEWEHEGWDVGIATGDRAENLEARVVVATLETQKHRLLKNEGPDLLVVDEYQMLGDRQRGLNYELAIAMAPSSTQLLMLSGSVGNPQSVVEWLNRLGRKAVLVEHTLRPVPLEEVHVEALPNRIPQSVHGFWPRAIARALKAEMAPLLAFAPRRKAAEELAIHIARMLPEEDPLVLTKEQARLAGDDLKRLLKARVAYHHSGLDYHQRAGLIEPLAKAGQLRVVVATMGLAAGINFSMRSVLVTEREYRAGDQMHMVRPDELLQMFGRGGRRGLDRIGYVLVAPNKPRLIEARPLKLQRTNQLDWPSIIRVMQQAIIDDKSPLDSARNLTSRLFSYQRIPIGLEQFQKQGPRAPQKEDRVFRQPITEIMNPDGEWERKKSPQKVSLAHTFIRKNDSWIPALQDPAVLKGVHAGTLFKFRNGQPHVYGRQIPIARLGKDDREGEMVLTKWTLNNLKKYRPKSSKSRLRKFGWTLKGIEKRILPLLPEISQGGAFREWHESNGVFHARLDYRAAETITQVDSQQRGLISAPERTVYHEANLQLPEENQPTPNNKARTAADAWYQLGLIDVHGHPTRRGIIFSFFNYGEGLMIAAALEDPNYPIPELIYHLANIRAGHRFGDHESSSGRLGNVCRTTYRDATFPGYLHKGLPPTYGEGAAEILMHKGSKERFVANSDELKNGDIQRARMEWKSLLRHIAHAPDLNWTRWIELRTLAREFVAQFPREKLLEDLPALTAKQKLRHKSFLIFG